MKKAMSSSIKLFVFAVLTFICAFGVQAAPSKTTVRNAYKKYRSLKHVREYGIKDFDRNGISDMVYFRNGRFEVCTYNPRTGKVVNFD